MLRTGFKIILLGSLLLSTRGLSYGQSQNSLKKMEQAFYRGDFQSVVNYYERRAPSDSLSARTYYLAGRSYRYLLQPQKAIVPLKKAHHLRPSSPTILYALGKAYNQSGNLKKAKKAYRKVLRLDSTNFTVRLALAEIYFALKEWQQAIKAYSKLLEDNPDNSLLHGRIARCYAALGRTRKALIHFKHAHNLNPRKTKIALQLSGLYYKKKQWAKALQVVNKTLTYHPRNTRLLKRRANINFEQDSVRAAARGYQKVLQLGDTTTVILRKLGISQIMLKNYKRALPYLKKAYRRNPASAATNFYLGIAYRETNHLDQSVQFLNRAADIIANDLLINVLKQLARSYDAKQNLPAALDAYKLALDLNPALSEIYFRLAVLYDTYYKDKSVAVLYYRKYLRETKTRPHSSKNKLRQYAADRIQALKEWIHFH